MTDFYLEYKRWFERFYNRPFACTREEWRSWCNAPRQPVRKLSDIEFDTEREREGDAQ